LHLDFCWVYNTRMLYRTLITMIAPMLSLIIVTLGNGLFNTLVTVRMHLEGESSQMIGFVSGAYYAGLVLGSFRCERLINKYGHIRAYAAIASVLAVASIMQGLLVNAWVDLVLRFICGMAMAGVFVVIESWMLAKSERKIRGQILSVYMIALYASQASGQFLLNLSDPKSIIPFCLVALFSSLSVVPIVLTLERSPDVDEPSVLSFKQIYKISASGVIAALIAGLLLGSIYGLMPLFLTEQNYSLSQVALIMSLIIYGGMAMQYPVGKLSDHFDRRRILLLITVLALLCALIILFYARYKINTLMAFAFLFGGFTFTMYPIAISLVCDNVGQKDLVAATQSVLLTYGIGAAIGPIIAPMFNHIAGQSGLILYFIILCALLSLFLIWRDRYGQPIDVNKQQDFVALTRTSPIANEFDPRQNEVEKQ